MEFQGPERVASCAAANLGGGQAPFQPVESVLNSKLRILRDTPRLTARVSRNLGASYRGGSGSIAYRRLLRPGRLPTERIAQAVL